MSKVDVSAIAIFHNEKYYAIPALKSLREMVRYTRDAGINVEVIAVLDKADALTAQIVKSNDDYIHTIIEADCGDLGLSRNTAFSHSRGEYVTFFDGDDLWGEKWIVNSYNYLFNKDNERTIIHPEYLMYFDEHDFDFSSTSSYPNLNAKSFWFRHISSTHENFDPRNLLMNNVWSANSFANKNVYKKFPYRAVDRLKGFGVEDWAWNLETTWNDMNHEIAPNTVHIIRVKQHGSLGRQNMQEGLLLPLPEDFDISRWG
ncbi:hypothetical protein DK419_01195 [Methylobacterium terrae]|uniref:Glycosyltransferase 2-like domain-containing protein n=1 Tax=Methylobacterium terrae TaxID=2202827 RepID=A0A2U8WFW6_9HYPH|nr:glycosyltransferase family A protein [Methylobacterium terrae]AWN45115.1 hypothetical protein DK419_01195 [Methylobacterium terrae]